MIIGRRNLELLSSLGNRSVEVSIYAPESQDGVWVCRYTIDWPDQKRQSFAAGVDSIQALHLALQKIGMELYVSPHHLAGDLKWEKSGDGYGFPVPKNGRDMLIGADKAFEG
ncbi:DUF6968 family protein [Methylobacterium mesophilicum]|uniref:DUF6968 family protein n=1 Tax=Methylobacterium mesophilicum TaxID=39956 RepID=UPI002F2C96D9